MKIFLSHAHEQKHIADALSLALRQEGHEPALDADFLPAGDGYHAAIREAIEGCDLFVYLISPASLEEGCYARTELGFARKRWPNARGHVLPVMVVDTALAKAPPYLVSVTVLKPSGDVVAETVAQVAAMSGRPGGHRGAWLAAAGLLLAAAGGFWWFRPAPQPSPPPVQPPCLLDAVHVSGPALATLEVGTPGSPRSFVVAAGQASLDVDALTVAGSGWIIEASAPGGRIVGRFELSGCPDAPTELHDEASELRLRLSPRP